MARKTKTENKEEIIKTEEKEDAYCTFIRTYIGTAGMFIKGNKYKLTPEQQDFFREAIKRAE